MISSNNNPLVRKIQLLQKKKRERTKKGVFIVEGLRAVKETPENWKVNQYIVSDSFKNDFNNEITNKDAQVNYVTDNIYKEISDTKTPQGLMAIVEQKHYNLDDLLKDKDGFFIIGDEIQDPGNLGTIIRTAHGAGATGVLLSLNCVDLYNPKTIRASMGSIFHIPVIINVDAKQTINKLENNNVHIYAADLKGHKTLYEKDYTEKTAFVIGNEANGITKDVKSIINNFIKIPMPGKAESLNASVAAGICMFEVVRQRSVVKK